VRRRGARGRFAGRNLRLRKFPRKLLGIEITNSIIRLIGPSAFIRAALFIMIETREGGGNANDYQPIGRVIMRVLKFMRDISAS